MSDWLFAMVWTLSNENRELKLQVLAMADENKKARATHEAARALKRNVRDYLGG